MDGQIVQTNIMNVRHIHHVHAFASVTHSYPMSPALCMLSPVGFRGGDILQRAPVRRLTLATRIGGIVLRVHNAIRVV